MERQALSDVLFALAAAREHNIPGLNRTALQRLLFLCAALFPLAGRSWGYTFSTARFGPFSKAVSHAADQLALLKLVEFQQFGVQTDGSIRAIYAITDSGAARAREISKITVEHERRTFITTIVGALDIYGPAVISKIATREPSYVDMRQRNDVGAISLSETDNKSVDLVDRITRGLKERSDITTESVMEKILAYFDFLSAGVLEGK